MSSKYNYLNYLKKYLVSVTIGFGGAILWHPLQTNAAPILQIKPISWDVIGLDSNKPTTDGPDTFNIGARVCNVGDAKAANVTANFVRQGTTNSYITITGSTTLTIPSLPAGTSFQNPGNTGPIPANCTDFYFNAKITRDKNAWNTVQPYQINVSAKDENGNSLTSVSTPAGRQLYIEKLVSQNRNSVLTFSGSTSVQVGDVATYTISGSTSTGYEQLVFATNFPNTVFQVLKISTNYTQDGVSNNANYADACGWDPDPARITTTYRSCIGPENYPGGKVGNTFTTTYVVKVIGAGSATVTNLVYDFSGSSYHYNTDYGTGINLKTITATAATQADLSLTKTVDNSTPTVGQNVTYTITVNNSGPDNATNVKIKDILPTGLSYVSSSDNVGGFYNPTTGIWDLGTVPKTGSATLQITAKVNANTPITNIAQVSASDQTDPDSTPNNNIATEDDQASVTLNQLTLSGKVWDDADNSANNTFTNINTGTETGTNAGGLNAILVNASGNVIATTPVAADGTYTFSNVIGNQNNVTIRLSTTAGTVGSAAPAASIPANWTNTSPLTTAAFNIGTSNITGQNFGIEQLPDTNPVTAASQSNPGGITRVQVSALSGTDPEDGNLGTGKTFKIVTLPTNGTLYYNGTAVTTGQNITLYDPTKLTIDPNDGALTISFTYAAVDAAGKLDPSPATVTIPFSATYSISGKVWDDADNSANNTFTNINTGTETGTNAGGLNAILVNASGNVIATTPVAADGTYTFSNVIGNQNNVTIRLSTTAGTVGSAAPAASIPANWTNTSPLTTAAFNIGTSNITGQNFGIEQLPDTNPVTAASQSNPGGITRVQVSALSGTDPEDGNLGTGKTFKIVTLPTNGTLYYNGTAVTTGQNITLYDPTKLTIDPNDGALTISFTYAAVDAAGKLDPSPATVTIPFSATTYLLLVKRITAINGDRTKNPNDNTPLNLFVDDTTSTRKDDDNNPMWKSGYLLGAINAGKVKPGDEIEYTVYFLNPGGANANSVRVCDRITANQDFKVGGYATSKDMELQLGTSTVLGLTSANDSSDRTQFISANGTVPTNCYLKAANDNGTLVIDVTGNANTGVPNLTTLPGSTAQATPNDSYGFFRFITKVKP